MSALTAFEGVYVPPPFPSIYSSTVVALLDAAGEKAGVVLQAPKTGNIRKIHWRAGTVTSATDTDVRVETVSATDGFPTGTLFGTNTNGTVLAAAITTNSFHATTLTADAAVTKGDVLAVVITPSGTPNYQALGSFSGDYANSTRVPDYPYNVAFIAAAWAKAGFYPSILLEYSDGSFAYQPSTYLASDFTAHTYASNTLVADEHALMFTPPVDMVVSGAWFLADLDGDADIVLYEGTTALATVSLDKDIRRTANSGLYSVQFAAAQELAAGTTYYLSVKPTTTTSLTAYSLLHGLATHVGALSGGTAFTYAARIDAGAWSSNTLRRFAAGLIISQLHDGASSGSGGSLHHGLLPPHFHPHGGRR